MTEDEYWFWMCNIPQVYQPDIERLLAHFGTPREVYKASAESIADSQTILPRQAAALLDSRRDPDVWHMMERLQRDNVRFIPIKDPAYPEKLLDLPDAPFSIYVKGDLPDPNRPVCAVVGARACSGYGREMTGKFTSALAIAGVQIVSGLALGVDAVSARAAIEAAGKAFAVLGSGIDVIYPRENIELYYQIILTGGGIISEYPPGTPPLAWQFPHRNRLISALSDRLLIMEARRRSGTLSTARHALEQGRDIMALPGRIGDALSEGCNRLIADGAGILLSPEYLLEDIFGSGKWDRKKPSDAAPKKKTKQPRPYEADTVQGKVLLCLTQEPKSTSEIANECRIPEEEAVRALYELVLVGLAREISKDFYVSE